MSVCDPGLRRVSVHAGTAVVDLALPSGMPVAALLPPIVDALKAHGVSGLTATRYRLSILGSAALDSSTTLARSGVRDGDVLVLSQSATPPPAPRFDDVAEAVSETLNGRCWSSAENDRATRLTAALAAGFVTGVGCLTLVRNAFTANGVRGLVDTAGVAAGLAVAAVLLGALANRAYRDAMAGLTLSLVATAFAAVAGFLAVPGNPGTPNMLLAAAAVAVTAVLAMRVSGCGTVPLTAVACFATVVAVAAFGGVVIGVPVHAIGALLALASLGLLGVAARAAILLSGLSPKSVDPRPAADDLVAGATRADAWLASLESAFASSAASGAVITVVAGTPRLGCAALAAATGALLLLRANAVDKRRTLVGVVGAVVTVGTTLGVAARQAAAHGPWIAAATALVVAGAVYLGFVLPRSPLSPITRKGVELVECLILIAMVPLTCWICGLYAVARGLHPTWA
ncbi:hypothetical protein AWC29_19755 [Mycobacterium triplex]|uniref:EccD-like transmembrane domain-containing protein n=1 Tax=Mycobacterium triplex TaxID=47839 RepID=A0ABX3W1I9_9MYCO|nr:hypothetical protein AWC29_19755 [Mycobacterium triplex]